MGRFRGRCAEIGASRYEYTRPAPSITKPRENVIIRLCSIECNFAVPLTDPSNAAFQHDMEAWAAISNRTFVWDYVVNFGAYVLPFPNYYSIGPNVRYFLAHGARGMCKATSCRADALPSLHLGRHVRRRAQRATAWSHWGGTY